MAAILLPIARRQVQRGRTAASSPENQSPSQTS